MDKKQLRFGNYVMCLHGMAQIEYFTKDGVHFTDGNGSSFSALRPVELNEELYEQFGFEKHHADFSNGVIMFDSVPHTGEFIWKLYPNELGSAFEVKEAYPCLFAHQLQNLYFALTGEELEVKELVK